jgi:tRNA 2-selenouridine synthase
MGSRPDSADYGGILRSRVALLDTRAPAEFARGAFPGAVNLPLMSDEERAAVGRCYKERGQAAAIDLGHQLLSGAARDTRVQAWVDFARANPDGYLYCFRGGLRSQIAQQWLAEAGIDYPRISGGYKAMRRCLIDSLPRNLAARPLALVAGATGSGKTRAVNALDYAVDLEGLARHRGSAFGRLLDEQPTQIDFENALAIALWRQLEQPGYLLCEDEGRLIGRLALPEALRLRMVEAPLLVIDEPLEARVSVLLEDYIGDLGRRYRQRFAEQGPRRHRERLLGDLSRIRKRLGGERLQRVAALMQRAFDAQADGQGSEGHRDWIRLLLTDYYDPMYEYQMARRQGTRLCVGSRDEVIAFARGELAHA